MLSLTPFVEFSAALDYFLWHVIDVCPNPLLSPSADPNMAKLHSRRGRALLRLGRFAEANDAFSLVLEATSAAFYGEIH